MTFKKLSVFKICIHQLQRATDMKSIFKMTSVSKNLCFNLDNIVSDHTLTVEPRFNEPPYNEVLDLTNDLLRPINGKMYENEPPRKENSLWRTCFVSPLVLRYIDVPLHKEYEVKQL